MRTYFYKGFGIRRNGKRFEIVLEGVVMRTCRTLRECKERIDTQTV